MHQHTYTTHVRRMLADMYTPVSVYMRLRDIYPQSALMESSDYHDSNNSRSFIAINPVGNVSISHGKAICTFPDGTTTTKDVTNEYKADIAINEFIQHFSVEGEEKSVCGLYGYTSFNAVRYFENIDVKDTTMEKNDAPDMMYIFFRDVIVFDHFNNTMTIVSLGSEADIDNILRLINRTNVNPYDFHPVGETTSPLTDDEHKANIRRGIQHCLRGDVFQIVLSRRFCQKYEGDDFKL